ncbi:uncharacterized protein LOC114246171 [Bombyx mandarina]|uniref:Secreted protein n=2 Tax=Bombyx TaxID=7090 RepID=A0A8R2HR17_BOMMO|nr:uncharacterized protein LOC110385213 [Bombyx mori]XP_028034386.1 uncharacterized protein LOC114246171 [Bombyx mandarina]
MFVRFAACCFLFFVVAVAVDEKSSRQKRCIVVQRQSGPGGGGTADAEEVADEDDYRRPGSKNPRLSKLTNKRNPDFDIEFVPEFLKKQAMSLRNNDFSFKKALKRHFNI